MSISSVKVGRPIGGPKGKVRGSVRWRSAQGSVRESGFRRGAMKVRLGQGPEAAPVSIAATPVSFISTRNFLALLFLAGITIFLVGAMVLSSHLAVGHSYEISQLTGHKLELQEINRQLKTELASVSSLDQLEIAARETLGLIAPPKGRIVVIE